MKKLLPIIIAVFATAAFIMSSAPAQAANATIKAARWSTPPSWDQYCHHVFYHAKNVDEGYPYHGHYCRWRSVEISRGLGTAAQYETEILGISTRTVSSDSPLASDDIIGAFVFNVSGPGATSDQVHEGEDNGFPSTPGIADGVEDEVVPKPVVQIRVYGSSEWIPLDATTGVGTVYKQSSTFIDDLSYRFDLAGSIDRMADATIRVGVRYDQGVETEGIAEGYHGVPQPHYIFSDPIPLEACFDPDNFGSDFEFLEPFTCGAIEIPPTVISLTVQAQAPESNNNNNNNGTDTTDSDGDGYRDAYEITSGSDPYDANSTPVDRDGDGDRNSHELACGSDPDDASSLAMDNDMDCDNICDAQDANDADGPCGTGRTAGGGNNPGGGNNNPDGNPNPNDDNLPRGGGNLPGDNNPPDFSDGFSSGGCTLSPQSSMNITPLWMGLVAALSLLVLRRRK